MKTMMKRTYTILCVAASLLLSSCADVKITGQKHEEVDIFPDYKEVTVPYNIAPLNFAVASTVQSGSGILCLKQPKEAN